MTMKLRIGYWNGYLAGQQAEHARYERENQRLVEQLADARLDAREQRQRADRAVDLLVQRLGLPAISESAAREHAQLALRTRQPDAPTTPLDPYEELPLGHEHGSYESFEAAALRFDGEGNA
jgi:hypothetical protein